MDDVAVIRASLEHPERFGEIFDRHFDVISNYLRLRVGSAVGEDLAAQTFLVAFDHRSAYDLDRSSARPWLFGIAANLLRHHKRDEARMLRGHQRAAATAVPLDLDGIAERVDAHAGRSLLIDALASLPRADREALLLYALGELSYAEIAEALEVPIGTVRSRISRARGSLREPIERLRAIEGQARS
jgi:RNA polymerase sigma-70 factor (ECF subfamily)